MIVDVSQYQGKIDWTKVIQGGLERVILRSTVKSGEYDARFKENFNALKNTGIPIDVYKFSYVRTLEDGFNECEKVIKKLKEAGALNRIQVLWLDLEKWGSYDYTKKEAFAVALGYFACCAMYGVKMGIYCNYYYLKNIIDRRLSFIPIWLARYNSVTGDYTPFNVVMWQYSSSGKVNGISGNVDVNKLIGGNGKPL